MPSDQKDNKTNIIRGSILAIVVIGVGIFIYMTYFAQPDINVEGLLAPPVSTTSTGIDTSVLERDKVKGLTIHGVEEVKVQYRGKVDDPFKPF